MSASGPGWMEPREPCPTDPEGGQVMAYYRKVGDVPAKRHTRFDNGSGGIFYEELIGEEGFSSDSSLLYHRYIPSAVGAATPWELPDQTLVTNAPLLPRHYKLHEIFPGES